MAPSGQIGSLQTGAIKITSRLEAPSPWLYIAGACVTLAGLYAVNYELDDPNTALVMYSLATGGYLTSYLMRRANTSARLLNIPALICLAALIIVGMSTREFPGFFTMGGSAPAQNLQALFAWLAILHTFTMTNNSAVLFACVPCMTMIALVSTTNPGSEIQNAFLSFVGAATFLMVHENYLRTRRTIVQARSAGRDRLLFGGQLILTAVCLSGSLLLANVVAIPIRTVGYALLSSFGLVTGTNAPPHNVLQPGSISVEESQSIELAHGPETESDVELMSVKSPAALYLRGTTFDYYSGQSFKNNSAGMTTISRVTPDAMPGLHKIFDPSRGYDAAVYGQFEITPGISGRVLTDVTNSKRTSQRARILGGTFRQVYAAGEVVSVILPGQRLMVSRNGAISSEQSMRTNDWYSIESLLPDTDPSFLRTLSTDLRSLDPTVAQLYLERTPSGTEDRPAIQQLVDGLIKNCTNNYDRVYKLKEYISSKCRYNLQTPAAPRDRDLVEYFLFQSHEGYCDSFGGALTILCRYAGIPARLASGFLPGEIQSNGDFIVRERDKHIWTEVYFPGAGWVPFDATVGATDISNHAHQKGRARARFIVWFNSRGIVPPLIAVSAILLLFYVLKKEVIDRISMKRSVQTGGWTGSVNNAAIILAFEQVNVLLGKAGCHRSVELTPYEYAEAVRLRFGNTSAVLTDAVTDMAALHVKCRYSPKVATAEEVARAKADLESVRRELRNLKRLAISKPVTVEI